MAGERTAPLADVDPDVGAVLLARPAARAAVGRPRVPRAAAATSDRPGEVVVVGHRARPDATG